MKYSCGENTGVHVHESYGLCFVTICRTAVIGDEKQGNKTNLLKTPVQTSNPASNLSQLLFSYTVLRKANKLPWMPLDY